MLIIFAFLAIQPLLKTIITFVIVFGILIFIHELGHYLAAKGFGIMVEEFALGFGPILWSRKKGETLHSLRAFPLGGFCKMPGEDPVTDEQEQKEEIKAAIASGRCFNQKPVIQRIIVVAMGPIMNVLLAFALLSMVFAFWGLPTSVVQTTVIDQVLDGSPAAQGGMEALDRIIAINGVSIDNWEEMSALIAENPEKELLIKVERHGELLTLSLTPQMNEEGKGQIGILSQAEIFYEKIPFYQAIGKGFKETVFFLKEIVKGYLQIISRKAPAEIGGVVKVAQLIGEAAQVGLAYLITFTAFISINLAIINLLPIPALDGGRLLFLFIELVRGKPVNQEREGLVHFIGFILLMVLMVVILVKDLVDVF